MMSERKDILNDEEMETAAQAIRRALLPLSEKIAPPAQIELENMQPRLAAKRAMQASRKFRAWTGAAACIAVILAVSFAASKLGGIRGPYMGDTSASAMPPKTEETAPALSAGVQDALPFGTMKQFSTYEELAGQIRALHASLSLRSSVQDSAIAEGAPLYSGAGAEKESGLPEIAGTNSQTEGIGESDIIKTDGRLLYAVSQAKVNVYIVEEGGLEKAGSLPSHENESVDQIFAADGRLVTISGAYLETEKSGKKTVYVTGMPGAQAIRVYNMKDPANPKLEREFRQDGTLAAARMIGTRLYTVTQKGVSRRAAPVDQAQPGYFDSAEGGGRRFARVEDIGIASAPSADAYTIASALDVAKKGQKADMKVVYGAGSAVYCSDSAIYCVSNNYGSGQKTDIVRIAFSEGSIGNACEASVDGLYNDIFSFGEHEGNLRAATVSSDGKSRIHILDSGLRELAKTDALAEGESIKSVRYIGPMAYVVTFRETDPLFTVDLSDPYSPSVLGKLKLPGFSSYLHPISEGMLLGIGYGAGSDGKTESYKYSLFDVSDPKEPKEAFSFADPLDETPAVLFDYRTGVFSSKQQVFLIPLEKRGDRPKAAYSIKAYRVGAKRIELLGEIENAASSGSQQINRAVLVDGTVYSFNEREVSSYALGSLEKLKTASVDYDPAYAPLFGYNGWIE
jgi:uncharacterized secreted protein with C-terminal beta-propeller domain